MKTSVLHVLWSVRFGGVERMVHDLAKAQREQGRLEVAILAGKRQGEFLAQYRCLGVPVHFANLSNGFDGSPHKLYKVFHIFQEYDILHFHSFNPFLTGMAVLSGKKIIYTVHGGFGFGRPLDARDRIKAFLLKQFLNRYVGTVTFNSHFTKGVAEQRYGLWGVRREVVYNGVAMQPAKGLEAPVGSAVKQVARGKFVVGTSSRFVGFKRIDRLIKAFGDFQRERDALLLLVGDGPLRADLRAYVEGLGLSEKVLFTGYRENVRAYQELMDVCVFPSEWEPFGLVAVEALALGKPTLVFEDSGGSREVVGALAPEDVVSDREHLVRRLSAYYDDRTLLREREAERKRYAARFTIERTANQFFTLYQRLAPGLRAQKESQEGRLAEQAAEA